MRLMLYLHEIYHSFPGEIFLGKATKRFPVYYKVRGTLSRAQEIIKVHNPGKGNYREDSEELGEWPHLELKA